ncbi:girdin [Helicoverpa armigera]|uniref:girdin n=1 Tax=Helicoverpa armigera TaxID=29058 RepID=UPI003082B5DF
MDNILNKDIFKDRDLDELSPDYKPRNFVLRMQMRRTLAKDTHNHGVLKNINSTRKSMKRPKESYNINKEIGKLRHEFNNINLKNRVSFKRLEALKLKPSILNDDSQLFDSCLKSKEDEDKIFSYDYSDDSTELEIRNDNDFRVNQKIKPLKHIKIYRETQCFRKPKQHTSGLLDLNKDINENNEDIFRVECSSKSRSPHNFKENTSTLEEQSNNDVLKLNISPKSPNNFDGTVSDLQNLLIMMTISSNSNDDEDINNEVECNFTESPTSANHLSNGLNAESKTSIISEGIDDILSITPIKVQVDSKETTLLRKFVNKWKCYVNNRKNYACEQRQATLNNFFDKIAKKKMNINQSMVPENKSKLLVKDYNTYQHRYKIQKHIIALQKAKLEEQNRLIEELKYNRIVEASRQSVDDMREDIRKAYYEIDRHLKPKIKCLTNELKIPEIEEPSLVLHCLKVPQFLQRMEKRAREREEKHAMIHERRRQMEEERVRLKQQAELAKAEMDKEEKTRRIQELREKRRKEKIENIRKKQWASRLRALIVMADLHYEKSLKAKYGIKPFRKLIEIKRDNIEKAKAHYIFQLKNNTFLHWMWYTEDMWIERNFQAENFHRKKLLRKGFDAFKRNHHGLVIKKQVADDYYDLYVTQMAFRMFRAGINVIKKENEMKWQKAVTYHSSNLLFKTFTCWRTLPALNALKREQEARKARWREKVLQVVPDYTPPED